MKKILIILLLISSVSFGQQKFIIAGGSGGGSGGSQAIGADFRKVNDSLMLLSENPVRWGADSTGVSNSLAAFIAAKNTGRKIVPSPGTYLLNGTANTVLLTLGIGQILDGVNGVTLTTTSNSYVVRASAFSTIKNIIIVGSSSKSVSSNKYQTGIVVTTSDTGFTIQNVTIKNMGGDADYIGGGIHVAQIKSSQTIGGTINNVNVYDSYEGITFNSRGEYVVSSNIKISNCHVGFYNEAGNTPGDMLTIQHCDTGYILMGGTNSAHSVLSNSEINHNTVNLVVDGIVNGHVFSNVMFYVGNVVIRNSTGLSFPNCDFSTGTITLTNNTNLYRSGKWVSMARVLVSGEDFGVLGETRYGATAVPWIDQYSTIDTVRFRGPTRVVNRITANNYSHAGMSVQSSPDTVVSSDDGVFGLYVMPTSSAYTAVDSLIGGEYTPTLTNNPAGYNSNVASSTHVKSYYHKIGNIIFFGGTITATATSGSTNSAVAVSLPFASNLAANDITGGAEWNITVGVNYQDFDAAINTDATNDRVVIGFLSHTSTSLHNISYWGSYKVK